MAEFTFEIEEHLLTLSENEKVGPRKSTVWALMVPAKFDIRAWSPDHTKWARELLFQWRISNHGGCL